MKLFARFAESVGVDVQVIEGQKMIKSMLLLGQGQIEMQTAIVGQFARMSSGTGPYKKMGDTAIASSKNIRSLIEYGASALHLVTWEDTGIKSLEDIRGRKIYVGPGGGGAGSDTEEIIRLATGMEPNVDYDSMRAPWGEGMQAMRNRQVDVMMRIAPIGSAVIQEFGLSKPIRFIGLSEADQVAAAPYLGVPGRS